MKKLIKTVKILAYGAFFPALLASGAGLAQYEAIEDYRQSLSGPQHEPLVSSARERDNRSAMQRLEQRIQRLESGVQRFDLGQRGHRRTMKQNVPDGSAPRRIPESKPLPIEVNI